MMKTVMIRPEQAALIREIESTIAQAQAQQSLALRAALVGITPKKIRVISVAEDGTVLYEEVS